VQSGTCCDRLVYEGVSKSLRAGRLEREVGFGYVRLV